MSQGHPLLFPVLHRHFCHLRLFLRSQRFLLKSLQLLADFWPHGDLAQKLGIFREANGFSERANVLLDEQGNVEWIKVYEIKTLPNLDEVFAQLKK